MWGALSGAGGGELQAVTAQPLEARGRRKVTTGACPLRGGDGLGAGLRAGRGLPPLTAKVCKQDPMLGA